MIVPTYWAESRLRRRTHARQITVRRFGWSDVSEADAQANADNRALEALDRLLSGEKLPRREPKVAYNGAVGVPIREEIVERHGETIVTRNSYGALCLNTPNVLFADVDFATVPGCGYAFWLFVALLAGAGEVGWLAESWLVGGVAGLIALVIGAVAVAPSYRAMQAWSGGPEKIARRKVERFLERRPGWSVRVYRTPAGLRVLAMHRPFDPNDAEVAEFFHALGTDPVYAQMCRNQQCFRARLTAKPWRIGVSDNLRPRPGVWPVAEDKLPLRTAWIERYEAAAKSYAACRYLETLGSGAAHPDAKFVQELHDRISGATSGLPIA